MNMKMFLTSPGPSFQGLLFLIKYTSYLTDRDTIRIGESYLLRSLFSHCFLVYKWYILTITRGYMNTGNVESFTKEHSISQKSLFFWHKKFQKECRSVTVRLKF